MQYSLNKDLQHLKWQQLKLWISSPDCRVAMDKPADAVSAYTQVKNGRCSQIIESPKSECPDIWIRPPRHKWPKSWSSMEDPVVPLERNIYGHPLAGLLWVRQFEKIQIGNVSLFIVKKDYSYLCMWMDIKLAGKKQNLDPMWIVDNYRTMFESRISAGRVEKLPFPQNLRISSWSYDMAGHAKKCVERYCELANKTTQQLYKSIYSMHRWPPLQRRRNEICWRLVTCMLSNCSKMLILGTNWTTWYSMVSKQARTIHHKMDQCLWQTPESIDFIYSSYLWIQTILSMWVILPKQCRLGLFQDSDFAGDLEDSKSTSGGTLCVLGRHTFVPISWMCKKQTAVSHSSTESEIISLDTGLRLDGLPALELWDLIVSVLGNISRVSDRSVKTWEW